MSPLPTRPEDLQPEPYHDLKLAEKMGLAYFNHAQSEGAPEEIVDRYRQFVDDVLDLQSGPAADQAAAAPMGAPMPVGMPMDPMAMGGGMPPEGMPPMGGPPMPVDQGAPIPMPVAA